MSFLFKRKNKEFEGWSEPEPVRYEGLWNEGGLHEFVHDAMTQPAAVARDRARVMRMYTAVYDYVNTDGADVRALQEKLHFALLDRTAALQSACREAATPLELFANFLAGWRFWALSERLLGFVFRTVDDEWVPRYHAATARTMPAKGALGRDGGGQRPGDPQPALRCSELFRAMWRENVAVPLALQMQDVAFGLLARERAGDALMSAGLTTCLACFTRALDYPSVSARFEDRYLRETEAYCADARRAVAAAPDAAARVRLVGDIVARETANAAARLRDPCAARVTAAIATAFVADSTGDICRAFVPALRAYVNSDSEEEEELSRIYHLAVLADRSSATEASAVFLRKRDDKSGRALVRLCHLFREFVAAKMRETLHETLAQAAGWEQLVDIVVRLNSRFGKLVQTSFEENCDFALALHESFKEVFDEYEHSVVEAKKAGRGGKGEGEGEEEHVTTATSAATTERQESLAVVLAKCSDRVLRRRKKSPLKAADVRARLGSLMSLFPYAEEKHLFMVLYAKYLAQRILNKTSVGLESEAEMVLLLRRAQGAAYTARVQQMLADFGANVALARAFRHDARLRHVALPPLDVVAVSRSSWPVGVTAANAGVHLPPCVAEWLAAYDAFFRRECPGRAVQHTLQHARAELRFNITDARSVLLVVDGHQAACLCAFTRARTSLALSELERLVGVSLAALRVHLRPLVLARLLLATDYALAAPASTLALNPAFPVPAGTERVTLLPDPQDEARLRALAAKAGGVS